MNIWLIQTGEPLPTEDSIKRMRTGLLAEKLVERGHAVFWWTSAFDHIKKTWIFNSDREFKKNGLHFFAIKGMGYKKNISLMRFIDHRIVAWKFFRRANKMKKPDVILASTPPHDLAFYAKKFANENNIPLLIDTRDPWPDIFIEHLPLFLKKVVKFILFNDYNMVKKTMQEAAGIISVTDNFMDWALNYANRKKRTNDKVFSLGYKKKTKIDLTKVNPVFFELEKNLSDKFIVFFVGTFSKSYHNPMILVKVAELLTKYIDIHFVIAGEGELQSEIKSASKILSNITLTGWLNHDEIEFWLAKSKVGVCPTTKRVNLPTNKAYAYLSAGLPIISAFEGDLKEIIQNEKIGFYYSPGNVDELADCILKLHNDKLLYEQMSINAKKIFDEKFDADIIYEEYAKHIENVFISLKS